MPFIPFLKNSTPQQVKVAPADAATVEMVIRNQLMELLLDYLHGKPNNEQTAYEAEQVAVDYWKKTLQRGGVEW